MKRPSRIILICEDQAQRDFALGFLNGLRYPLDKVVKQVAPPGFGDAKAFVLAKIAEETSLARSQTNHKPICILSLRDLDNDDRGSVSNELQKAANGYEEFLFVLPQRNMESWLAALTKIGGADALASKTQGRIKKELGRQAYKLGKTLATQCKRREDPPEALKESCPSVERLISACR
jgi:hypothetical protein